jgi:hypothetical protein
MRKFVAPVLSIILFLIPFLWLAPGQMDIGGDTSRLYFYDPLHYLQVQALYGIIPSGIGGESVSYWGIPYFLLLILIKSIVNSPTLLIDISHGFSLSMAFLATYLIAKDFVGNSEFRKSKYGELTAILSGIFYILTPTLVLGWDKEIITHNEIFLNPLMFFLLFRFISRNEIKYMFIALFISVLFSPNFSFVGAPDFFSFYPLVLVFILLYTNIVLNKIIPVKKILLGLLFFILLQLFHLGPQLSGLFTSGSSINANVFSPEAKFDRGLGYFLGVAPYVKVSFSWLNLAQLNPLIPIDYAFIIFPFIIFFGFLWNRTKQYLLTAIFFLIIFFFVTANITSIGFNIYVKLFDIPGFSMFRNYFGQWVFVFTFFYTLLFGQALLMLFQRLRPRYITAATVIILAILVYNAWPFFNGSFINQILYQSKNVTIVTQIDPEYEEVLSYIRDLPIDGKFISFPLTDPGYQIITGKNGGAYQGPSTISYLTGKDDFTGYGGLVPFNDTFLSLVKNNDINGFNRLFAILNIKYIFYNSDPKIYDNYFPEYPYTFVRGTMPENQKGYQAFLAKLPIHKVKDFGPYYHIYEVNTYLPHFYVANQNIYATDAITPYYVLNLNKSLRSVVYTQEYIHIKGTDVILTATSENPLLGILDNIHLHTADPFISKRMDNILYPFIVWKEKQSLKKLSSSPDDYVDYSLLYLAKRVSELHDFQDTPITHKSFQEPKLWQFNKWKSYYSWESNLSRIGTQTETLVNWINSDHLTKDMKYVELIKVNEGLSGLQYRLIQIVNNSNYSDSDKTYLLIKIKGLFTNLYQAVDLKPVNTHIIHYSLTLPNDLSGQYIPYLQAVPGLLLDPSDYKIKVNNTFSTPVSTKLKSDLIQFKRIDINDPQLNITVLYKPDNLLNTDKWKGEGIVSNTPSQTILAIANAHSGGGGFSERISNYQPLTQYIITFDYYTQGDNVLFGLYEKQKENNQFNTETYFNKVLSSSKWKTQQSLVTSSQFATDGSIQFTTLDDNYSGRLHIRNFAVTAIPDYTILFRKVTAPIAPQTLPNIQFEKINPTRYIIHVTNAINPYTLVFSEAFGNNWKIYLPSSIPVQSGIVSSYFGGEEEEEKMNDTLFNFSFLANSSKFCRSYYGKWVCKCLVYQTE